MDNQAMSDGVTALYVAVAATLLVSVVLLSAASLRRKWRLLRGVSQRVGSVVGVVSDLYVYPIKSCAGVRLSEAAVSETGLRFDRRFMLVRPDPAAADEVAGSDPVGASSRRLRMVSQRELPLMALVVPQLVLGDDDGELVGLRLSFRQAAINETGSGSSSSRNSSRSGGGGSGSGDGSGGGGGGDDDELRIDLGALLHDVLRQRREEVVIWPSSNPAENGHGALVVSDPAIGAWFRRVLGSEDDLQLVYMDDACQRIVPDEFSALTKSSRPCRSSFSDVTHYLLTAEYSLADLNRRIMPSSKRVPMDRFRPNIVVTRTACAWAEDHWAEVEVETADLAAPPLVLSGVKHCTRCVMPSTDQVSGYWLGNCAFLRWVVSS
jgi:uncharacterized protein YcbX